VSKNNKFFLEIDPVDNDAFRLLQVYGRHDNTRAVAVIPDVVVMDILTRDMDRAREGERVEIKIMAVDE